MSCSIGIKNNLGVIHSCSTAEKLSNEGRATNKIQGSFSHVLRSIERIYSHVHDETVVVTADKSHLCVDHFNAMVSLSRKKSLKVKSLKPAYIEEFKKLFPTAVAMTTIQIPAASEWTPAIVAFSQAANDKKRASSSLKLGSREEKARAKHQRTVMAWVDQRPVIERTMEMCAIDLISMSHREYKAQRTRHAKEGFMYPTLPNLIIYMEESWSTTILHEQICGNTSCKCCVTSPIAIIEKILNTAVLKNLLTFWDKDESEKILGRLKLQAEKDNSAVVMHGNMDPTLKTIIVRINADGFRAVVNKPVERLSMFLINFEGQENNPHFDLPIGLYEGAEDEVMIRSHFGDCNGYPYHYTPDSKSSNDPNIFLELSKAVHNGFEVNRGTRNAERYNLVAFFVPDLSCFTKLQGRQSCSAEHGCPFCTMLRSERKFHAGGEAIVHEDHDARTTPGLFNDGHEVENIVKAKAATRNRMTDNALKKVYEAHNGQKSMPMIYCGGIHHCPPDILHLMLGMYRMVLDVKLALVSSAGMEYLERLPAAYHALRLYTMEFKVLVKLKEGGSGKFMSSMKDKKIPIQGNEGKILERHMGSLLQLIFEMPEEDGSVTTDRKRAEVQKIRNASLPVVIAMKYLHRLAVILRNPRPEVSELDELDDLIRKFGEAFKKLGQHKQITDAAVYFHILLNDVSVYNRWMVNTFGFGIGLLWSSAAEHSNKFFKNGYALHTNFSLHVMFQLMRRAQFQFFYCTDTTIQKPRKPTRCSKCGTLGHNSKNKYCVKHDKTCAFIPDEYFTNLSDEEKQILSVVPVPQYWKYKTLNGTNIEEDLSDDEDDVEGGHEEDEIIPVYEEIYADIVDEQHGHEEEETKEN